MIHPTVEAVRAAEADAHARGNSGTSAGTSSNLNYHGGTGGIGVETTPEIYLVFWGSQWSSDPSGEAALLEKFLGGVSAVAPG